MNYLDTIYALSTSPQRSGIAVVRVSGDNAVKALLYLTKKAPSKQRYVELRTIFEPGNSEIIDRGLVIWFEAPDSFTGENMVEFHIHGSPIVVRDLLKALKDIQGFRHAEPGEFTRRAFYLNKINLDQVEALADLISSETSSQRRLATKQLEGTLGKKCNNWRSVILESLAQIEAEIEFPDIDNIKINKNNLNLHIKEIMKEMDLALSSSGVGQRIRSGISIAVIGPPNVGKSSIINKLTERNVSIVSEISGTTRDIIEVQIEMSGFAITLFDTAGFSSTEDPIELEGIKRAEENARKSDIVLKVFDIKNWSNTFQSDILPNICKKNIFVFNKSDLLNVLPDDAILAVSCKTGFGFDKLHSKIMSEVEKLTVTNEGLYPIVVRHRHQELLEACRECLNRAFQQDQNELLAEDLRLALRAIGKIVGQVSTEEMLDRLFTDFCIGK